jgi:transcriptional regulator with XRE-family HTH domain
MLAIGKVKEIERLLAEGGLSQRKIAATVGCSRALISAIARGARPDYEARRLARLTKSEPLGPIERCPTCGARVYTPCRLCRVRKMQALQRAQLLILRRLARQQAIERMLAKVHQSKSQRNSA